MSSHAPRVPENLESLAATWLGVGTLPGAGDWGGSRGAGSPLWPLLPCAFLPHNGAQGRGRLLPPLPRPCPVAGMETV